MTFKELIRFAYGLFMGTSTPFLKPTKRYLFPPAISEIDEHLALVLGGSAVCGVLRGRDEMLVINTNQGEAGERLKGLVESAPGGVNQATVVLNSAMRDSSAGLGLFAHAKKIIAAGDAEARLRAEFLDLSTPLEVLSGGERVLEIGGERVRLIPIAESATGSDLVVFLEGRSILFAGALFYNRIQPVLHAGPHLRPKAWIQTLESLLERLQPRLIIPAEGDPATPDEVREFVAYLKALTDPSVEFHQCRARFDWPEIPSYTSLEENFDMIRGEKSHTTLG